jgi:hypothetical protein
MPRRTLVILALSALTWVGCIAAGFAAIQRYANTAGIAGATERLPDEVLASHRRPDRPLLVMAVHPLCPCTEASLAELGELLARSAGRCDALVLEYSPSSPVPGWRPTAAQRTLSGIPIPVLADRDGALAARLGAHTSGHVALADANGAIRFRGGLTIARGHRGRSPAQDAILNVIAGKPAALTSAPVYGCGLENGCTTEVCR